MIYVTSWHHLEVLQGSWSICPWGSSLNIERACKWYGSPSPNTGSPAVDPLIDTVMSFVRVCCLKTSSLLDKRILQNKICHQPDVFWDFYFFRFFCFFFVLLFLLAYVFSKNNLLPRVNRHQRFRSDTFQSTSGITFRYVPIDNRDSTPIR